MRPAINTEIPAKRWFSFCGMALTHQECLNSMSEFDGLPKEAGWKPAYPGTGVILSRRLR